MRHKHWFVIEFKYDGEGWIEYDRTQVPNWAKTQTDRCKSENKDAEVRLRKLL
jgi:hypothetical protein